jgi:glycosylphosphatidylinositol transamidase
MLLSIAHQFKQSTYWAKDVIFLFTQYHHKGLHQWLKSYHGESGVDPLDIRSGYIQIALDLDLPPSSDKYESIQMVYEGINGYLPNLDVISTLQRVGDDFRAKTSVHPNSNENEYLNRLTTMFTQLSIQATTIPAKPSGLFLAYDIHGVSLVGVPSQHSTFGWVEIGILIEEAFRSYNNLLERLHHSYNFYIMLSYSEFVSLQMYLPVVGILGAIPLIYSMLSLSKLTEKFTNLKQRPTLGFYNYRGPFLLLVVAQVSGWFSYTLLLNYSDRLNNLGVRLYFYTASFD